MIENRNRTFIAIDLKSFYASVECVERGLNPLSTNLVVADASRTEKTICLAVSPSLKAYKIPGRARLFEVVARLREVNRDRKFANGNRELVSKSIDSEIISKDPSCAIDYIAAKPRMALYMEYSTRIYNIYLKYVAPEDIHVYSIDEVFMDVTSYLNTYGLTARELASRMISDVLSATGITATAGIGTNLYLCKVAMDIVAKHTEPDENGVRIAEIDEMSYRKLLWDHRPLTDFWRVGAGYKRKLEENGLFTMGDIARCSLGGERDFYNEDLLYKLFGINAELLIDHAWGYEPCTIADVKAYKPENNSISSGQVLQCPYEYDKAKLVVIEMAEALSLDLVEKNLLTNQLVLTIGYDIDNLTDENLRKKYQGEITTDYYGRKVPKHAHGTENLEKMTASTKLITEAVESLFCRVVNPDLLIRRINITAGKVVDKNEAKQAESFKQLNLFTDFLADDQEKEKREAELEREEKMQQAMLTLKKKFGKNAILKGRDLCEGATTTMRNNQIGGHNA